jgi:hypothetical protein
MDDGDWINNFDIVSVDPILPSVYEVHRGYLKDVDLILEAGGEKFLEDCRDEGYDILFTGHSQGGAQATLMAFLAMNKYDYPGSRVDLVTFGAPPSLSAITAATLANKINHDKRY